MDPRFFQLDRWRGSNLIRLVSSDGRNRLTRACVVALTDAIAKLTDRATPLIIAGNPRFFSVGADLNEIAALTGPDAYEFSRLGQVLMNAIENFPAPVTAWVEGHCMGGGLDLALACDRRISAPSALFGHRGAALGLMTGWGGTRRLPRLIGKGQALEMFVAAETITAVQALELALVHAVSNNPLAAASRTFKANHTAAR
jgi:enoyl-CoA hydratase